MCYVWIFVVLVSTVGQVWFTAQKTDQLLYTEPSPAGVLIFPDNISSLGAGYDHGTSIFTAPVGGLYFFTATLQQYFDDTYFYMMVNYSPIRQGRLDAATTYNTATINSILMLQPGDTVHVELRSGDQIYCTHCNFDGYMLYEAI